MTAETMIANTFTNIASTTMAFADGFFSSDMFEYTLWIMAISALTGLIYAMAKKVTGK